MAIKKASPSRLLQWAAGARSLWGPSERLYKTRLQIVSVRARKPRFLFTNSHPDGLTIFPGSVDWHATGTREGSGPGEAGAWHMKLLVFTGMPTSAAGGLPEGQRACGTSRGTDNVSLWSPGHTSDPDMAMGTLCPTSMCWDRKGLRVICVRSGPWDLTCVLRILSFLPLNSLNQYLLIFCV